MGYFEGLLMILAVLVAIPYVAGPLLVLGTFHLRCPTRIVYFDADALSIPADVSQYLTPAGEQLERLGFRPVAHFCLPDLVPNVKSINALFVNDATAEGAMINCIYATVPGQHTTIRTKYAEFVTRFRDGVCLQTSNSSQIGAFRAPPDDHTVQFWDVQEIAELHRRHRLIGRLLSSAKPWPRLVEEFHEDVEEYLQKAVLEEPADYQVQVGILRKVSDGYRPTLKGAFLLTWQELWPLKLLRKQARLREARRWLSEIGEA